MMFYIPPHQRDYTPRPGFNLPDDNHRFPHCTNCYSANHTSQHCPDLQPEEGDSDAA